MRAWVVYAGIVFLAIGAVGALYLFLNTHALVQLRLSLCARGDFDDQRKCAQRVLADVVRTSGISRALEELSAGTAVLPKVLSQDCHESSHNLGDALYFDILVPNGDYRAAIDVFDITTLPTPCQMGFVHGFIKHMTQEATDPKEMVALCDSLSKKMLDPDDALALLSDCAHGVGHGLALASAQRAHESDFGDAHVFMDEPLRACEHFSAQRPKDSCMEGAQSVFIGFHIDHIFGFKNLCAEASSPSEACYSKEPLHICEKLDSRYMRPCSYIMALKLVQRTHEYQPILSACAGKPFADRCVQGAVTGSISENTDEEALERTLSLCAQPLVRDVAEACYVHFTALLRFYGALSAFDCARFPAEYQQQCSNKQNALLKKG